MHEQKFTHDERKKKKKNKKFKCKIDYESGRRE